MGGGISQVHWQNEPNCQELTLPHTLPTSQSPASHLPSPLADNLRVKSGYLPTKKPLKSNMPTGVLFHIYTAGMWVINIYYILTYTSTEEIKDFEELFWTEISMFHLKWLLELRPSPGPQKLMVRQLRGEQMPEDQGCLLPHGPWPNTVAFFSS